MRKQLWLACVGLGLSLGAAPAGPLRSASPPVPATQEIEVLDPGTDPAGRPAVVLRTDPATGLQVADLPPTVLVLRYYFTGERTFQAQMLPGGPVVVSANHPRTLDRVYAPVTLPPGAPQVTYTSRSVEFDYGPQTVTLTFGACGRPNVHYAQSTAVGNRVRERVEAAGETTRELWQRTGIPAAARKVTQGARGLAFSGADAIHDAGRAVAGPVVQAGRTLPGVRQLSAPAVEARALRDRDPLFPPADPDTRFVPRDR